MFRSFRQYISHNSICILRTEEPYVELSIKFKGGGGTIDSIRFDRFEYFYQYMNALLQAAVVKSLLRILTKFGETEGYYILSQLYVQVRHLIQRSCFYNLLCP